MSENSWKRGTFASAAVLVILVIIGLLAGATLASSNGDDGDDNTDGPGGKPDPEVVQLLTVTSVTEKCSTSTDQNVVKYDVGALKGVPPRKWSDALSTPLSGGLDGVMSAVCTDPLYGATVANMLANLNVDGVSVRSLNPWIRPFTDVAQINDKAAAFVPLLDVKSPSDAQVERAVAKNHEYQEVANRVNTLLSRFKVTGTHAYTSVKNWHLAAGGLKVGGLPEVGLDKRQDKRPALVLELTSKNDTCPPLKRIGFNLGDKRPEVFPTPDCDVPPTDNPPPTGPPPSNPPPTEPPPTEPPPTNPPTETPCDCPDLNDAEQPVPTPEDNDAPTKEPSSQPTHPVDPENPPDPNDGGYNGGSTDQPGQSGNPDPVVPSSDPTNTGDPGGF